MGVFDLEDPDDSSKRMSAALLVWLMTFRVVGMGFFFFSRLALKVVVVCDFTRELILWGGLGGLGGVLGLDPTILVLPSLSLVVMLV